MTYIALLDILGYGELIENNDTEKIEGLLGNIPVYIQGSLAENKTSDSGGYAHFDVSEVSIHSLIISDTLIFWTQGVSTLEFFQLIGCLQRLMTFCHNRPGLFLRGALTAGDFNLRYPNSMTTNKGAFLSHTMIYGKGLVQAHEIEKNLELAGCLVTEEAWQLAKDNDPGDFDEKWKSLFDSSHVILYNPPTKKEAWKDQLLINWVSEASNPTRDNLEESFGRYRRPTDDPKVRRKIDNTLAFYDHVKAKTT